MKTREIGGGLRVIVSEEEENLIKKIEKNNFCLKEILDEREKQLAFELTSKGILLRKKKDNKIGYKFNNVVDLYRN